MKHRMFRDKIIRDYILRDIIRRSVVMSIFYAFLITLACLERPDKQQAFIIVLIVFSIGTFFFWYWECFSEGNGFGTIYGYRSGRWDYLKNKNVQMEEN